ncbi:MAG: IPT/TIG domain-containing protein [Candidatus Nomurabacteria bacterium]|jgi:uncharacterized protein (TIGR02145 family)|nr:IPT/TIG domain-containing protein [Candidatus Nomurabacteria bacterium]
MVKNLINHKGLSQTQIGISMGFWIVLQIFLASPPASALPLAATPAPSISINLSIDNVNIHTQPTGSNPSEITKDLSVTITTDNPTGYHITAKMSNEEGCLRRPADILAQRPCANINHAKIDQIPTQQSAALSPNTWALAFHNGNDWSAWHQVPVNTEPHGLAIRSTATAVTSERTDLRFGSQTDFSLPADDYRNSIKVTALGQHIPPPTITNITPQNGPTTGGTLVTIFGTNFIVNGTVVVHDITIDNVPAASCNVLSATEITCTTPASASGIGAKNLVVHTWGGDTATADGFSYFPPPTITTVSPDSGSTAGGTPVTISGTNFIANNTTSVSRVTVGGQNCTSLVVISATEITCTTPAGTAGLADVTVYSLGGNAVLAGSFLYAPPPSVTKVSLPAVKLSSGGKITITGSNFINVSSVTIDGKDCTSYSVASPTVITCDAPPNTVGAKPIVVTTGIGASNSNITLFYATFMQDFNSATCATMSVHPATNSAAFFIDARDDSVYLVRRLADNKCWMVDNLAINGVRTLDSTNTDMNSGNYQLAAQTNPNSGTYCSALDTAYYPQKCGMHYTWTTAVLGSNPSSITHIPISICPKNWRLPVNGEYAALRTALSWGSSGGNVNNSAWRGLYAGYNGTNRQGTSGHYWTSYTTSTNPSRFNYNASALYPNAAVLKTDANSVRCLAR